MITVAGMIVAVAACIAGLSFLMRRLLSDEEARREDDLISDCSWYP